MNFNLNTSKSILNMAYRYQVVLSILEPEDFFNLISYSWKHCNIVIMLLCYYCNNVIMEKKTNCADNQNIGESTGF